MKRMHIVDLRPGWLAIALAKAAERAALLPDWLTRKER